MKIKRFFAKDMRTALAEVKETLGTDAVIMSNKKVNGGVEIVAAVDFDDQGGASIPTPGISAPKPTDDLAEDRVTLGQRPSRPAAQPLRSEVRSPAPADPGSGDSLRGLLERQQQRLKQRSFEEEPPRQLGGRSEALPEWAKEAFGRKEPPQKPQPSGGRARPAAARPSQGAQELKAVREEMASIRQLLEHQVAGLMDQDLARREPVRAMLAEKLRENGFHRSVADHFASLVPEHLSLHEALGQLPRLIAAELTQTSEDSLSRGGVIALVGPTGVGKTTTVAKLAARFAARYGVDQVALITTDNYRIGAKEQLATYGKIMGCPVRSASNVKELENVLYQLRSRRLILIDTAGMGQRDMRLVEQLDNLVAATRLPIRPYLVLSSTAQFRVLKETVEQFRRIALAGCIFTKLDEAHSIGEALSVLIQNDLPISYLTDGQRVPEDLRTAEPEYLARRAVVLEETQAWDESVQRQSVAGSYE
ncbi:flagellar biosynthesis protein FlhF [Ferrimonas sediminicola]|uniref:Flagellar biosynthesis protein FlhF n=1 Tax=Ferrimonas sediminicola TaxID=2569538 RepID=A0A4U1B935_9GAMM|nr:flagellar biosynthesis protein FlhF [Ferrimonas sediminicola]TKB47228.1 flagellar biosynthesis protein FlhF [Ferrimonas sediminicola]